MTVEQPSPGRLSGYLLSHGGPLGHFSLPKNRAAARASCGPVNFLRLAPLWRNLSQALRCGLGGAALALVVSTAGATDFPKKVLIVHSFGSAAPPFTTHSIAFETELTKRIGEQVDLDEVSLDHARYAAPDMEEALVEYLQKRQAKWQPDLVVPIGSPAGIFVEQYRGRLFPHTPILYAGMDRRRLAADALQNNAAFVGESFDGPGFIQDILQLAPETTNIVCVIGTSVVERYWKAAFQKDFEQFTNRVSFSWLNELPFDQTLERVSHLPPHSFIFLILLMRDATGVSHNADEALRRISEVANAPVNSIYEEQLGLGMVGGRLYRAEFEAVEGARVAIRILHGESATNFPPEFIGPIGAQYDWRELRRWKISESRLPRGSVVKFREPTIWHHYGSWIVAGVSVFVIQALLIGAMVANLVRRRNMERSLRKSEERARESEGRFLLVANSAPVLMWASGTDKLCTFFNQPWLDFTGRSIAQELGNGWAEGVHTDDLTGCMKVYAESFDARQPFTMEYRLRRHDGQYRWISDHGVPRYDADKNFLGYIGSCVDVTEQKRAEEEALRMREELAHVSRVSTLVELGGALAHELNQPLTAILSNAQAAARFLNSGPAKRGELREILEDIVEEDRRAGEIIVRMRAMLKKEDVKMAPESLNQIVREVLGIMRSELLFRRVMAITRLAPQLPLVRGDRVRLQQVLMNLIVNACDAMADVPPAERRVTIETENAGDGFVQASVADGGSGFPVKGSAEMFEAFRTTKPNGLGLGLVICRSIIESHGGRLWVANNNNRGATVRFTVRAEKEANSGASCRELAL
jgi:PAS domain S-box-containing protein